MKMSAIREMSDAELKNSLSELIKEGFNLKFQKQVAQIQSTAKIKSVKKDIARVKTEQTKRNKIAK